MKNQKGFANIILVVVIVILVGAVGYFAFVKKSGPVAQQTTPTPAVTKTEAPTPTPQTTSDLRTYSNTTYSFSFSYPKQLNVKESPSYLSSGGNGPLSSMFNVAFSDPSKNYAPEHLFEFYASVIKNDKKLSPKEWFVSQEFPSNLGGNKSKIINGVTAVDFESEGAGGRTIYFFLGTKVIVLVEGEMSNNSFEAVISSFKSAK